VPTLFLFDRNGKTARVLYGAPPDLHEQVRNTLDELVTKGAQRAWSLPRPVRRGVSVCWSPVGLHGSPDTGRGRCCGTEGNSAYAERRDRLS
jgi:hypothetical protein